MLIEFVEGPLIEDLDFSEEDVVQMGQEVTEQISGIAVDFPYFMDVSTEEKWEELVEATLQDMEALMDRGRFHLVDRATARHLERWAFSTSALSAIRMNPGYVHGDLTGDNVFVLPDGYRVIDWQRPMLGPIDLNLATLLDSLGFNPSKYVDEDIVRVMYFLRIHWLTQCARRWIPEAVGSYDQQIMQLASRMENVHTYERNPNLQPVP